MFGRHEDHQQPSKPAPSPMCDVCGEHPAYAQTYSFGWVCSKCWNTHYVPMLQAQQATLAASQRSTCCPACALKSSENSRAEQDKWMAAHLVSTWHLCKDHQDRISALLQDTNKNPDLVLSVVMFWYRFKTPQQAPKKGA